MGKTFAGFDSPVKFSTISGGAEAAPKASSFSHKRGQSEGASGKVRTSLSKLRPDSPVVSVVDATADDGAESDSGITFDSEDEDGGYAELDDIIERTKSTTLKPQPSGLSVRSAVPSLRSIKSGSTAIDMSQVPSYSGSSADGPDDSDDEGEDLAEDEAAEDDGDAAGEALDVVIGLTGELENAPIDSVDDAPPAPAPLALPGGDVVENTEEPAEADIGQVTMPVLPPESDDDDDEAAAKGLSDLDGTPGVSPTSASPVPARPEAEAAQTEVPAPPVEVQAGAA